MCEYKNKNAVSRRAIISRLTVEWKFSRKRRGKECKKFTKIFSMHYYSKIQQWNSLNCKPERSLNQCYFIITATAMSTLNEINSYIAVGNQQNTNKNLHFEYHNGRPRYRVNFFVGHCGWYELWNRAGYNTISKWNNANVYGWRKKFRMGHGASASITLLLPKKLITHFQWKFIIPSQSNTSHHTTSQSWRFCASCMKIISKFSLFVRMHKLEFDRSSCSLVTINFPEIEFRNGFRRTSNWNLLEIITMSE